MANKINTETEDIYPDRIKKLIKPSKNSIKVPNLKIKYLTDVFLYKNESYVHFMSLCGFKIYRHEREVFNQQTYYNYIAVKNDRVIGTEEQTISRAVQKAIDIVENNKPRY